MACEPTTIPFSSLADMANELFLLQYEEISIGRETWCAMREPNREEADFCKGFEGVSE
jgi:hypothetical protein